ncbi:MAG: RNA 2',3'-cyclic phosphodiesterase [Longimicrobiales bacterium]
MRVFIGINIPKKQRTRVHRAVRHLREGDLPVRWIEPDNFHITLKFLGEVRRERIPVIEEALERVAAGTRPFTTTLAGFGGFPTVRHPDVIWIGAEASSVFRCMKQELEWALGDVGFGTETRAFHPHVTVGRVHEARGAGVFRGLDTVLADLDLEVEIKVRTIDLMRSQLSKEDARYSVLSRARLASA